MKSGVAAQLGLMIALMATTAYGEAPPYNKNLEPLKPLIGKWTAELTLPVDIERVGKAGDTRRLMIVYKWTGNRQSIASELNWEVQGKMVNAATSLIVWDPAAKKIIGFTSHADGSFTHGEHRARDGNIVIEAEGAKADGLQMRTTFEFSDVNASGFAIHITKRSVGDQDTTPPPGPGLKVTCVQD